MHARAAVGAQFGLTHASSQRPRRSTRFCVQSERWPSPDKRWSPHCPRVVRPRSRLLAQPCARSSSHLAGTSKLSRYPFRLVPWRGKSRACTVGLLPCPMAESRISSGPVRKSTGPGCLVQLGPLVLTVIVAAVLFAGHKPLFTWTLSPLSLILNLVVWILVPGVMLVVLWVGTAIMLRVVDPVLRVSARAGYLAGWLFLVIYVASQFEGLQDPHFTLTYVPRLSIPALAGGVVVGIVTPWIVRFLLPTRMVGALTLVLTFSSTAALFDYLFATDLRDITLFVTTGAVAGVLVHLVIAPDSLRRFVPTTAE